MSDYGTEIMRASELSESDKARGRIPKFAWGYVRGQYELANRTYEDIGNEFNCTPSAVFYVVKQATIREITATLELPVEETAKAEINRIMAKSKPSTTWAERKTHEAAAPKAPSQVELMAQQANAMLEDANCKRLFDATSKIIVDYVAFQAGPEDSIKKQFKDSLHDLRRAIASIELKVEMTAVKSPTTQAPAPQPLPQRVPEVA